MAAFDDRDVVLGQGNEHNPSDPFGRELLVVRPDDAFRFENWSRGGHRARKGALAPGSHAALVRLLEEAGFPDVEQRPFVPDSTICTVRHGGRSARVGRDQAKGLAGWAELLADLDRIVTAARKGEPAGRVTSIRKA